MLTRLGRLSPFSLTLLLIAGCALLYCVWFVRVPLTEIDEVRYSEATREMITSGDYIIPHFNEAPRYQKPILYYWIQSASVRLLGVDEAAARLPSALFAIVLVLLLHAFLRFWLPRQYPAEDDEGRARARGAAFLGAVALATLPMIAVWARASTTDMTLTFFISTSLLAMLQADLVQATEEEEARRTARCWYLLAALAFSLAFLTKGPMGLAIPGLAWLIYQGLQRNLAREARCVPWFWVALIFLGVNLPWYAMTYVVDGPNFLQHFFMNENVGRFTNVMEGHGSNNRLVGLLLYLPMALVALFPYSPFLVRELLAPFAGNRAMGGQVVFARMRRFGWVWLATVIGIFAVSKTQLPSYIQSIAAAAALLFALHVLGRLAPAVSRRTHILSPLERWGFGLELSLLAVLGMVFVAGPILALAQPMAGGPLGGVPFPRDAAHLVMGLLALVGAPLVIGMLAWAVQRRSAQLIGWVAAGWSLLLAVLLLGVAPLVVNSGYRYSVEIGHLLHDVPDNTVINYTRHPSEDLVYYAQRKIGLVSRGDTLDEQLQAQLATTFAQGQSAVVVLDAKGELQVRTVANLTLLQRFGDLQVMRATPLLTLPLPLVMKER
ncbi:MAG TPA: phospholipid carrier-dependent glycosyltransferase [Armatimonadota bacterium]